MPTSERRSRACTRRAARRTAAAVSPESRDSTRRDRSCVTVRDGGGGVRRSLAALAGLVVVFASHAPVAAAEPLRLTVGTVGSIGALDPRTGTSDVAQEVWNLQYPTLT